MAAFIAGIFGMVVGSFLNVVINRLDEGLKLTGRSRCPHCKHQLSALDLVPVMSYLVLRGKCRYCGKPISLQYPLVELGTGVLFASAALKYPNMPEEFLVLLVVFAFLVIIGVFDFKHFLILDKVVFPAFGVVFLYSIFIDTSLPCGGIMCLRTVSGLAGAGLISGFFFLQYYFSKGRWIGFGDVKFGLFLGMAAGFQLSVLLLFAAYLIGAVIGVGLIALGKKNLSSKLPFGSFLAASAVFTLLWGEYIIDWYLGLIGFSNI